MANHTNKVLIVRVDGQEWIKGDEYSPKLTDKIKEATRKTILADAKKFVKAVAKKLKMDATKLEIVPAVETRDDKFNLVDVTVTEGTEENNGNPG